MTKGFLYGYRSFIYFIVLTLFQVVFIFKDIHIGKETFTMWIVGCTVWLGANKSVALIDKINSTASITTTKEAESKEVING